MSRRVSYLRSTRNEEEAALTCAAWAPRPASDRDGPSSLLVFARGSTKDDNNSDVLNGLALAEYDFDKDSLSDTISAVNTKDGIPLRIAVHPKGAGVLCSFSNSFKLFDIQTVGSARLKASDSQLSPLQGIGMQNCITFDRDGLLLATGGKDGHVRVFQWPSLVLILDEPKAFKSIQDLDISLDSAYLAATSEDKGCRVWEIAAVKAVADLIPGKEEKFSYCRFSRDGKLPFLFVSSTKSKKDGAVGVWDISDWSKVGYKKLSVFPISSLAVTRDGKYIGIGNSKGDVAVVNVKSMAVYRRFGSAHVAPVTALEFSKQRRALLSLGAESTARVNVIEKWEWKDWQLYSIVLVLILFSALLFWLFFESTMSDDFWQFPMGRSQPARPPPEAIWGNPNWQNAAAKEL
ncbi:unnamed protein product [Sphagnum balticum]